MRRLRSRVAAGLAAIAATLAAPGSAHPQSGAAEDGALFLLLPVGARAVGVGQAIVADRPGSEAVWWNAAAIARADEREVAIHHSQSIIGTGDAITLIVPSSLLGVLGVSVNILNYGDLPVTDAAGTEVGTILPRSFVYAGTYATTIGTHLGAGITYKVLQFRLDCSGLCPAGASFSATTSALDAGVQYDLAPRAPVAVGVAVRNLGPRLQVNDSPQSDPLPGRLQVGVLYRLPGVERYARDTEVHVSGDLIDQLSVDQPSTHVGADVIWQKRVHVRAGYVFRLDERDEGAGPAVGFGLAAGSLVFDIARQFQGLSADAGEAPTYLSLRYLF
jgi:hypothetical protein